MTSHFNILQSLDRLGNRITAGPNVTPEEQAQRKFVFATVIRESPVGLLWGALYFAFGESLPGLIPAGYTLIIWASVGLYALTRWHAFFRFTHLFLSVLLPLCLQMSLGGFTQASAVVIWALEPALMAIALASRQEAQRWFFFTVAVLIVAGIVDPLVARENNLPDLLKQVLFVLNILGASFVAVTLLRQFVKEREDAYLSLAQEREKSERLLLNVLPEDIAAQLKTANHVPARRYQSASVLFADVVGSTPLAVDLPPERMVATLNTIFSHFDSLVTKYGLEKIGTMGDAYIVASGVPRERSDHAKALARMALDMVDYLRRQRQGATLDLQFRIGINSGPLVAGIIGEHRFHYDIWGDVVNTASRMESHGVPGLVQITRDTYELLKDGFICEPRGLIDVKGKGVMETWFLKSAR